jgi:hypothetical protein
MKSREEIETPESYFERHPMILTLWCLFAIGTTGSILFLFMYRDFEMHGWALMLIPPALYADFQLLTLILNPFASIYKDKFEINKHLLNSKIWYFNDLKKIGELRENSFSVIYNDDEEEVIKLNGLKPTHVKNFQEALHKKLFLSLQGRDNVRD